MGSNLTRQFRRHRLILVTTIVAASILPACGKPGEGSAKLSPGLRARLGSGPPGTGLPATSSAPAKKQGKGRNSLPKVIEIKPQRGKVKKTN
jgi:hypothetical protein